ncbi:lysozyme inhibitor LprI family protein [Aquipseudomonas alcaligenes]|uniref:Ypar15 n=1 Tax=Aquipseudomonas alcaligenes TaxID=43263 RepID=Q939F8_AQUAC|nr:Ypar15 [Pseudomonas alcaligenes]
MSRVITLLALLLIPSLTNAESACELPEHLCKAQSEYERADKDLNETYQKIIAKIKSGDFDDGLVSRVEITESLRESQRSWLKFKQDNCSAYYKLYSGGTSRNGDLMACQSEMTIERTNFLKATYIELKVIGI